MTTSSEQIDVLIVGAGLSGVGAAHHIATKTPWLSYALIESRDAIGGTWDLFRYPGVRSDSDMFTLGYGFRPWVGSDAIADGASIRRYIEETAAADGTTEHIRFGTRVMSADWSSVDATWTVHLEEVATGETSAVSCRFLYSCTGYYRYDRGHMPAWPGLADFQGDVVQPQFWPDNLDYAGKRVVVVGSGATAITLVPAMAQKAAHVTMLQRSPTYVASVSSKSPLDARRIDGRFTRSALRWLYAIGGVASYSLSRRFPQLAKRYIRHGLERHLPDGYDIDRHFTPTYEPWDQRVCMAPDGDLFETIAAGNASVLTDQIERFVPDGILLASGDKVIADVVVAATGLELLFLGGISVSVDGAPVDLTERLTYKGTMLEGVPNLAFAFGYTNSSWTLKCELSCELVTDVLCRMEETGFRQATPLRGDQRITASPFLDLTSGYVQRGVDEFPKTGDAFPWVVHQNYLHDYQSMRLSALDDGVLKLANPTPLRRNEELAATLTTGDPQ
jgi:monooxygenase